MPTLLLDPRLWGVLIFIVAEAFAGITVYNKGLTHGRAEVQVQFDAYVKKDLEQTVAEQVKRNAETARMNDLNQKVTAEYESLKTATATAVKSLDGDRLRLLSALAAARHRAPTSDPTPGLVPDASPEVGILGECLQRYEAVAGDAAALSDQVKGLQDYVHRVVPHE
jgi:hypothetical protein